LLACACRPAPPAPPPAPAKLPDNVVILAPQSLNQGADDQAPYWRPTKEAVLQAEAALPTFLQAAQTLGKDAFTRDAAKQVASDLPSYRRQYYGVTAKGRQLITLNALCVELPSWQSRRVVVFDGGPCFFTAAYDPSARRFVDFTPNGFG
jgi:hypothetical protein